MILLAVLDHCRLATGDWLLVTGDCRLVTGDWLLATGYWLLATSKKLWINSIIKSS